MAHRPDSCRYDRAQFAGRPDAPASFGNSVGFPLQIPVHTVPGGQSALAAPLHSTWHGAAEPQRMVQSELPVQDAVHPPFGHRMSQRLLPPHETTVPEPTARSQWLPPLQLTLPFAPVASVQSLDPSHLVVQFSRQLPAHVDRPAQLVVHPVPQSRLHVFFDSQL